MIEFVTILALGFIWFLVYVAYTQTHKFRAYRKAKHGQEVYNAARRARKDWGL